MPTDSWKIAAGGLTPVLLASAVLLIGAFVELTGPLQVHEIDTVPAMLATLAGLVLGALPIPFLAHETGRWVGAPLALLAVPAIGMLVLSDLPAALWLKGVLSLQGMALLLAGVVGFVEIQRTAVQYPSDRTL